MDDDNKRPKVFGGIPRMNKHVDKDDDQDDDKDKK